MMICAIIYGIYVNDDPLIFKNFDRAVKANPDAQPLFHSDRDLPLYKPSVLLKTRTGRNGTEHIPYGPLY